MLALHARVSKARNRSRSVYRRSATASVATTGGRGKAFGQNENNRAKVEAFEQALARVSRRLAALAKEAADELKRERLEAARAAKAPGRPAGGRTQAKKRAARRSVTDRPVGERSLRSPSRKKQRASVKAANARRQAKKDKR